MRLWQLPVVVSAVPLVAMIVSRLAVFFATLLVARRLSSLNRTLPVTELSNTERPSREMSRSITAFAIRPAFGSGIPLSFGKRYHRRNVVKASVRKVGYADL
jgi:hypothetical protein